MKRVIVYVRWFDSAITRGAETAAHEAHGILENECAGLLIREDAACVTIGMDYCLKTENYRCTLSIPKANVRRIKRFKV